MVTEFGTWLTEIRAALRGNGDAEVPCDGCTACCRSAQFVYIEPDETETLARIPAALLWPAPRRPPGHVVLGYDERGHCPMLVDDRCSIYEHRPRTCRMYDCRVFAAAGVDPGPQKPEIAARVRTWEFRYASDEARAEHDAIRASATALTGSPTERAVQAVSRSGS
jgi:Fe-S-cluster containining protein